MYPKPVEKRVRAARRRGENGRKPTQSATAFHFLTSNLTAGAAVAAVDALEEAICLFGLWGNRREMGINHT